MRSSPEALLAHYLINISMLVVLVSSGLVMLFLVYRKIRTRDEWRHKKVAFLSIWGLSCLFGTTWGLGFLDFGPLTTFFLFVSCILNSFQGKWRICQCLSLSVSLCQCLSLSVSLCLCLSLSVSLSVCVMS